MSRPKARQRRSITAIRRDVVDVSASSDSSIAVCVSGVIFFRFGWPADVYCFSASRWQPASFCERTITNVLNGQSRSVWQLLDLSDEDMDKVDVVEMNLAVARGIPGLENLSVPKFKQIVDGWAHQIELSLPVSELEFKKTPESWENDIRLFRLGVAASFLNDHVGIDYIDEQKTAKAVRYTDPSDLFLHGLIDRKRGTCGNMPALHVAIGRRLGWQVSLAAVRSHSVCRFDDGNVIYNVEATKADSVGMFAIGSDNDYISRYNLPDEAIACGSDLNSMTGRQMLGYFIALRARHFADTEQWERADQDYALARSLFPNQRRLFTNSIGVATKRGSELFHPAESGYPTHWRVGEREATFARAEEMGRRVDEINRINRLRMQRMFDPQGAFANQRNQSNVSPPPDPFGQFGNQPSPNPNGFYP